MRTNPSLLTKLIILITITILSTNCATDTTTPDPGPTPVSADIGPTGGTLESPDGALLTIPADALPSTTNITLEKLTGDDIPAAMAAAGITEAWSIGPEGTVFLQPVTITVDLPTAKTGADAPIAMGVLIDQNELQLLENNNIFQHSGEVGYRLSSDLDSASITGRVNAGHVTLIDVPASASCNDQPFTVDVSITTDGAYLTAIWTDTTNQVVGNALRYTGTSPVSFGNVAIGDPPRIETLDAYVCESEDPGFIRGTARFTQVTMPAFALSDGVTEINFTIGMTCEDCTSDDTGTFTGTTTSPISMPELVNRARVGFASIILASAMLLLISGANGFALINGSTGLAVLTAFMIINTLTWGVLPLSYLLPAKDGEPQYHDAVLSFGPESAALTAYFPDEPDPGWGWSQLIEPFQGVFDAVSFGNTPVTTGATYVTTWKVETVVFDTESQTFTVDPTQQLLNSDFDGQSGQFISAYSDGIAHPVYCVEDGTPGRIWAHLRDGGMGTLIGDVGNSPRRIRAAAGIAAVSNFGSGTLTIIKLDGTSSTVVSHVTVGDGPIGIDVLDLEDGTVGVVSTGFNDDTWTLTVINATTGAVVSNTTTAAPGDCTGPGHASWARDGSRRVIFSCNGSDEVVTLASGL